MEGQETRNISGYSVGTGNGNGSGSGNRERAARKSAWKPRPPRDLQFDVLQNSAQEIQQTESEQLEPKQKRRPNPNKGRKINNPNPPPLNPDSSISTDTIKLPAASNQDKPVQSASQLHDDDSQKPVHLSSTRFQDLVQQGVICEPTGRALKEVIGHEFLTLVQEQTMLQILNGHDCLAQAKTGTGKTLGFLIPSIERLYRSSFAGNSNNSKPNLPPPNNVSILVISPTRELAQQIAAEAEQLLTFLPFKVQVVIGGTNMNSDVKRLENPNLRCDLLIGTPGRLLDHLENSGLRQACSKLQVLVFDEADRLLDAGFKREIDKIVGMLPTQTSPQHFRQTLLFSATIPPLVKQIAKAALLPNYKFITTIAEYESSTHEHVPQHYLLVEMEDMLIATYATISRFLETSQNAKIILFFPTARTTQLFAELLVAAKIEAPIFEIHSRLNQSARTKATDAFRVCLRGVMVSSDVSARGMDFPGVTHVVQVGSPANREQYIHRLGRTARAGSAGSGLLILGTFESFFLKKHLTGIPIIPAKSFPDLSNASFASIAVSHALTQISESTKSMAYAAWLGFYNALVRDIGWSNKQQLVEMAGRYAVECLGCDSVPGIPKKTIGKMGLKGVKGLVILADDSGGGGRGGGGNSATASHGNSSQSKGKNGAKGGVKDESNAERVSARNNLSRVGGGGNGAENEAGGFREEVSERGGRGRGNSNRGVQRDVWVSNN
ncbi:hypothetical protein HK100_011094 [Physocladia obscura]|uniref:ATP-dependent RNA helicase n=1 Tax=Physocladia obscura TaxID=109957 RepID=A0AAD5T1V8_9FUNG|nr:hypothetical protein HK100_011094 [Physocladia obscura]